jgi:hypothetical protein
MISCQKNEVEPLESDVTIEQEIEVENLLADLDAFSEEILEDQMGLLKSATINESNAEESCPVITWYRNAEPRKMIIDFGAGCEGRDGKVRSGKIIITSASFENRMASRIKTFENFSVNGWSIEGIISKTLTFNREDKIRISEVNEDLTITSEENSATRQGTMFRSYEPGEISDWSDDITKSWGEVVTEWQDGKTVTKTISEENPLVFSHGCRQIVSGITSVSAGDKTWSINYGEGDCDNQAVLTRNGIEKIIHIGRRK